MCTTAYDILKKIKINVHFAADYLNKQCNQDFLNCIARFKKSRAPTFKGNTCKVDEVVQVINKVMSAAIVAGKIIGKP